MEGRLFRRTQSVGLALGAALLAADCAGPTVPSGGAPGQSTGVTSIDGANVELASFENSAFPYHGMIPNYQETGKSRPFLDVDDNGRLGHRIRGVVLLDALYGERDKFVRWVEGPGRNAFFISAYSTSSREGSEAIRAELEANGIATVSGLPTALTPGVVAFVDAGSVDHNDFLTSAFGGTPLRDIISRIGG